ncbi:M14 family zinc carboxypeptidase [Guptibacillus hwajinpoensis]|uniref:M14 family zinc carboxypeptidase n=1 Tax=Guptibacillus hwajinpoensis TaxID=208199 RepID=UPI001CD75A37|nr:M14 family zinc carboxypeptidase [Pseudalkalibacillus hwajinpoensis]MCA0993440.1 succinylglutamate desuccinylase/aspartoacylase family protein [Pseudalkalibacillus hwajinpoensis]
MKKQLIAGAVMLGLFATPMAGSVSAETSWKNVNWNETLQEEDGSPFNSENYDFVKYSEVDEKLKEIEKSSNRITVETPAQSSDGQDLYVVTVSDPEAKGKFGYQKALRKKMFKSPDKAEKFIEKHPDFKVPVMINASIHGTEFVGSDAALQLIERFATADDAKTKDLLENHILIFNVVANPDGRIDATRFNSNGIDLNRDFITQSQVETKHTVNLIKEWNPMVFLDLHGYVKAYGGETSPGLIEPCTPPHNPNYEYDLYSKWAMDQAESMEGNIVDHRNEYDNTNTDTSNVNYQTMTGTYIPQRDDEAGWDDYPPIFTPMYAMYHGAYGYTLEAPTNDWDGVKWHYDAVMGALEFSNDNKEEMIKDQIEVFKRGIQFDHPYHTEGFFPKAYILPVDETDPTATEKAVEHLMFNDIDVSQVKKSFTFDGETYPAGTYIVDMSQAKAGLANTMLWDGEDITDITPAMYDISAWNLPELWGFEAIEVEAGSSFDVKTFDVKKVDGDGQLIGDGPYVIQNSSVKAVNLVNSLIEKGFDVQWGEDGAFYVDEAQTPELKKLVKESGIEVTTASLVEGKELTSQNVTILKDGGIYKAQSHAGTRLALERLGFNVTEITPRELAENGLGDTDAFFYSGTSRMISYNNTEANAPFGLESESQYQAFKQQIQSFVDGGGKYVAIGAGASDASKKLGVTDVTVNKGYSNSNGIVKVDYGSELLTSGYGLDDYGFVYQPVWYSNVENVDVHASFDTGDFFVAGHWENRDAAEGQPVIVKERDQDVTLIGIEAGFRDHTDELFRLLSNAVFSE